MITIIESFSVPQPILPPSNRIPVPFCPCRGIRHLLKIICHLRLGDPLYKLEVVGCSLLIQFCTKIQPFVPFHVCSKYKYEPRAQLYVFMVFYSSSARHCVRDYLFYIVPKGKKKKKKKSSKQRKRTLKSMFNKHSRIDISRNRTNITSTIQRAPPLNLSCLERIQLQ